MKKVIICIITLLFTATCMTLAADTSARTPIFNNMRTVIIANTAQNSGPARYMAKRLREPFRIPYYQRQETSEILQRSDINKETLSQLAGIYHADIVLVPVVNRWYWDQYQTFWHGESITEYNYVLTVYAYDCKLDTFKKYTTYGSDRDESSVLNQPRAIMSDAMDHLMKQLPYKRIPTDLGDLNEGKRSTLTTTTEGHAKILAVPAVQAI